MKAYLLGIDIGTSACKTALFLDGAEIAAQSCSYTVQHPEPSWAEQNPDDWYAAVCKSIRGCLEKSGIRPADIVGIGIDGQSWSAIAVNEKGEVLCPDPIWMDNRSADICRRITERVGAERLLKLAGNPLTANYVAGKLIWYKENLPEVWTHTYKILQSNSFIAYRLTGKITMDPSQGYGFHCFDQERLCWDADMAAELGIPTGILPDIFPCHEIIGRVTREAASLTGLCEGTPVVAGGVDASCACLGSGIVEPGDTQEQGGTSGGMGICTDKYTPDPRLIFGAHVVPGRWLLQGGTTGGGGVLAWAASEFGSYERELEKQNGKRVLAQFDELAAGIAPGAGGLIFLPYMSGERTPIWDPDAKGVFYGIDYSKTKAHFIRAMMEGPVYSLRHNLDSAAEAGAHVSVMRATGGAAFSTLWTQMKADATGIPVSVPSVKNATGFGAAILAGVGTGVFTGFEAAVKETVVQTRLHTPDPSVKAAYDKAYKRYLELYNRTKGL